MIPLSLIVASDAQGGIGCSRTNDLPWPRCKEDMAFFRETTKDCPVIMGKNTFLSLPVNLKGRAMIVVSTKGEKEIQAHAEKLGATVVVKTSLIDAVKHGRLFAEMEGKREVFIIGGASIYQQALPLADKVYWTRFDSVYIEADIFFHPLENCLEEWDNFDKRSVRSFDVNDHIIAEIVVLTRVSDNETFSPESPIGSFRDKGLFFMGKPTVGFDQTKITRVEILPSDQRDGCYVTLYFDNGTNYKTNEKIHLKPEDAMSQISGIIAGARR